MNIMIIDNKIYKTTSAHEINSMIKDLPNKYCLSPYQLQLVADTYIKQLDKKRLCAIYNKIAIGNCKTIIKPIKDAYKRLFLL